MRERQIEGECVESPKGETHIIIMGDRRQFIHLKQLTSRRLTVSHHPLTDDTRSSTIEFMMMIMMTTMKADARHGYFRPVDFTRIIVGSLSIAEIYCGVLDDGKCKLD